jgi:plastocyanin
MNKILVGVIAVVVALAAVIFFVFNNNNQEDAAEPETPSTSTTTNPPATTPIDEGNTGQDPGASQEATNEVAIDDSFFSPEVIRVRKGTTVTWTNNDVESHTVTGLDGGPDSPVIAPGETYSFTFDEAGTFDYICTLHAGMDGQVVVTE